MDNMCALRVRKSFYVELVHINPASWVKKVPYLS